jgi:hypothetical protein
VWTQLWGSWALPFAWALTWRAMTDRRFIAPAAGLVALTAAFHYETGYLAFGAILILPFCVRAGLRARLAWACIPGMIRAASPNVVRPNDSSRQAANSAIRARSGPARRQPAATCYP